MTDRDAARVQRLALVFGRHWLCECELSSVSSVECTGEDGGAQPKSSVVTEPSLLYSPGCLRPLPPDWRCSLIRCSRSTRPEPIRSAPTGCAVRRRLEAAGCPRTIDSRGDSGGDRRRVESGASDEACRDSSGRSPGREADDSIRTLSSVRTRSTLPSRPQGPPCRCGRRADGTARTEPCA